MTRKQKRLVFAVIAGVGTAVLGIGTVVRSIHAQDSPPNFYVSYDSDTIVDPNLQQLYQNMANTLTGWAGLPNARLAYYAAVNNHNGCTINGWQGIISNVQANNNGYLVSVDVVPLLTSNTYGASAVVFNSDYSEQFQVNNDGTIQYTASFDPAGLAGQLPVIGGF